VSKAREAKTHNLTRGGWGMGGMNGRGVPEASDEKN